MERDELQQMLAQKRHEQPAGHFFKGLSSAVINRIQNPEPPPPPTFWQRLGFDFDTKSVIVCVTGAAVCGLLAYGLIRSSDVKAPPPKEAQSASGAALKDGQPAGQFGADPSTQVPMVKPGESPRSLSPVKIDPAGDRMSVRPRAPQAGSAGKNGN